MVQKKEDRPTFGGPQLIFLTNISDRHSDWSNFKNLDKTPLNFIFSFAIPLLQLREFRRAKAPTIVPTSLTTPGLNPEGQVLLVCQT